MQLNKYKCSVSLAIHRVGDNSKVLVVRRPDDDDEFPGMWGLPAASCWDGETLEEAAHRVGVDKLGVCLTLARELASGVQERNEYTIEMTLFEATLDSRPVLPLSTEGDAGVTLYADWRWGEPKELATSADSGSLCSRLLLESLSDE